MTKLPRAFEELSGERCWLAWRLIDGRKVPLDGRTGGYASWVKDPSSRADYATARRAARRWGGAGIGIVLEHDLGGLDLDHVRTPATTPQARAIVRAAEAAGLYTEISVSGHGYHVVGRARGAPIARKIGNVEVYRRCRRFFTISAREIGVTAQRLARIDQLLDQLLDQLDPRWREPKPSVCTTGAGNRSRRQLLSEWPFPRTLRQRECDRSIELNKCYRWMAKRGWSVEEMITLLFDPSVTICKWRTEELLRTDIERVLSKPVRS